MVQVHEDSNPKGKLADMLGMSLGQGIGNGINTYMANRSLQSVMQDKALESAPQSKKLEAIRSALSPYGEIGQKVFQDTMKIDEATRNERVGKSVYQSLRNAGYPKETAELWEQQMVNAPTGGQSDVIKNVNDLIRRSKAGKGKVSAPAQGNNIDPNANPEMQQQESEEDIELQEIIDSQDEGLTPGERIKRESERFKVGQPLRQEAATKLRGFQRDAERLQILDSLNNSGKLPKNFGLLNVDKEGNLRLPFAASPEAQRFVKTLNEFSSGAKDTFGSRVTNFDLTQFLKRFPTLLNSSEGRQQIAQQMKIVNEINSVYYKNLQDVYSKAGGARKIDSDIAEELAERKSAKTIDELVKRFDEIGSFPTPPAASEFKGRKLEDEKTGEILVSDGENWIPAE